MRRALLPFLLAAASCGTAPRSETLAVPGTDLTFEMVSMPRDAAPLPFRISKHEVTWGQFDRFYEFPEEEKVDGVTRPSAGKNYLGLSGLPSRFMEPNRPVTNLRYHSALVYCEWLSRKTGRIFRLPTEREWEAARGSRRPEAARAEETRPVGLGTPNDFGLYDMGGNVSEYCLEPENAIAVLRGGAWNAADDRVTPPAAWSEADPSRPFSVWWFRAGHSQGFRVVLLPALSPLEDRTRYAESIRITDLSSEERVVKIGKSVSLFSRVTGEVRNEGDRTLVELALKVHALTPDGKPHLEDAVPQQSRRATFNVCYPVLVNSGRAGDHRRPLGPGESRRFVVDLPMSFDGEEDVEEGAFGAGVLHLRFARRASTRR